MMMGLVIVGIAIGTVVVIFLAIPWIAYFLDRYFDWCSERIQRRNSAPRGRIR